MIVWPSKDPDERLDYSWTVPLDDGDTIDTYTITRESGTVVIDDHGFYGAVATAWLSGGADGETSTFTLQVVTTDGRTFDELASLDITANSSASAALLAAFPSFIGVPASTIEFWLTRAARGADSSWTEDDIGMGQMLLACHLMTLNGLGTGAEAASAANDYQTIRTGDVTLTRFARDNKHGEIASTTYGRQYLELARQNRGGPRVMATGSLPTSWPESA